MNRDNKAKIFVENLPVCDEFVDINESDYEDNNDDDYDDDMEKKIHANIMNSLKKENLTDELLKEKLRPWCRGLPKTKMTNYLESCTHITQNYPFRQKLY